MCDTCSGETVETMVPEEGHEPPETGASENSLSYSVAYARLAAATLLKREGLKLPDSARGELNTERLIVFGNRIL